MIMDKLINRYDALGGVSYGLLLGAVQADHPTTKTIAVSLSLFLLFLSIILRYRSEQIKELGI